MKDQIVIEGLLTSYIKINPEAPKKLLFLHGWQSNSDLWREIFSRLENSGYAIYALDLPGFGGTQAPKNAFSVGDYANFVKSFAEKMAIKDVVVVGHSFGGRVAIKLTAETKLVKQLVLVDSAGLIMKDKSATRAIAKIAKPIFAPKFMQSIRRSVYKRLGSTDYLEAGNLKETYLKVINEDLSPSLEKIKVPTLIIWGDKDTEAPLEMGIVMNKKIKGSEMTIFEGAGHFTFIDEPDRFANELKEFLK